VWRRALQRLLSTSPGNAAELDIKMGGRADWGSDMPAIDKQQLDSVAILFRPNVQSQKPEAVGTAFIVRFREQIDDEFVSYYLVTCEHCIAPAKSARFCTGDTLAVQRHQWTFSPAGDDVAAMDITDLLPAPLDRFGYIDLGSMIRDQPSSIAVGSELFMLGLFANEDDRGFNAPRARFGNISAMADARIPIEQGNGNRRPTHLGDMRSRTGFSGSPVFAYQLHSGYDALVQETGWLGVHSGQYPDRVTIIAGGKPYPADIPASMTIIVPAWALQFIEDDPNFAAVRNARRRS
jgi:hypothetical protein